MPSPFLARQHRRRLLGTFSGLLALAGPLSAQSSVWKITRGGHTLYLGGTCHILRATDFPLPAEFDAAFAASTTLYFETDIGRMRSPEMQGIVARHGMFTDGRTLDQVLTPNAWKLVQNYSETSGLPLEQVRRFKPWLFTVTMAIMELQKIGVSTQGVDVHYFDKATDAGKKTGELETFDEHIKFLIELGAGHESEMIANSIEELAEISRIMDEVLAAWKAGDIARLDKLMLHDVRTKYPAIFKSLFVDRNNAWMTKLDALLKTPEVEFVLVGAGHVAGKEGLLARLRARGCKIEQIKAR